MGFFKYDDASIWQKTNLHKDKKELTEYLNKLEYVNKATIIIKDIELPE